MPVLLTATSMGVSRIIDSKNTGYSAFKLVIMILSVNVKFDGVSVKGKAELYVGADYSASICLTRTTYFKGN